LRRQWVDIEHLSFPLTSIPIDFPTVPMMPTSVDLQHYLTTSPWNQIQFLHIYISLAVIGFAYFMPSDVLFSLWFFYLFLQAQTVVGGTKPLLFREGWPLGRGGVGRPYILNRKLHAAPPLERVDRRHEGQVDLAAVVELGVPLLREAPADAIGLPA
jgi:hypothetical protein